MTTRIIIRQPPWLGGALVADAPVEGARWTFTDIGDDSASWRADVETAARWRAWLGYECAIYHEGVLAWHGWIARVIERRRGYTRTTSAEHIITVAEVEYSDIAGGAGARYAVGPQKSVQAAARWGERWQRISLGGASPAEAQALVDAVLVEKSAPTETIAQGGGEEALIVEALGWVYALKWQRVHFTGTGTVSVGTRLRDIISADVNGIFAAGSITDGPAVAESTNGPRSAWEEVERLRRIGDGAGGRVGLEVVGRAIRYYTAESAPVFRLRDDGELERADGARVEPFRLRPNVWVEVGGTRAWLARVEYDAEARAVRWSVDTETRTDRIVRALAVGGAEVLTQMRDVDVSAPPANGAPLAHSGDGVWKPADTITLAGGGLDVGFYLRNRYANVSLTDDFTSDTIAEGKWQWVSDGTFSVPSGYTIAQSRLVVTCAQLGGQPAFLTLAAPEYFDWLHFWGAITSTLLGKRLGVRVDDGTNANYIEVGIRQSLGRPGRFRIYRRCAVGGAVTDEDLGGEISEFDQIPVVEMRVGGGSAKWSNWRVEAFATVALQPRHERWLALPTSYFSWTPVREGLVFYPEGRTESWQGFSVDFFHEGFVPA